MQLCCSHRERVCVYVRERETDRQTDRQVGRQTEHACVCVIREKGKVNYIGKSEGWGKIKLNELRSQAPAAGMGFGMGQMGGGGGGGVHDPLYAWPLC